MIRNILNKEACIFNDQLNIIYDDSNNDEYNIFIRSLFQSSYIIKHDSTLHGMNSPHIVICNDREKNLSKSLDLCYFFHIPLLIVDHTIKQSNNTYPDINFDPYFQIATSNKIYTSWNKIHDKVIGYNIYDESNKKDWRDIITSLCKNTFIIK